jgi:acetylornithine aminotransferase
MNTYTRQPVAFTHGKGTSLWDNKGKQYLDALSGVAVNTLGHAHPRLTAALSAQVGKLMHVSNIYQIPEQEKLADQLCALSKMQEVFLCNSGCEANEAAIKLARLYGNKQGIDTPTIIVMEKAFHGRTLATLSATGNRKVQAGFEPLVKGFVRVAYDDLAAIEQVAAHTPNIVAILVEPIQGEGGIRIADIEYIKGLRKICDQKNWLLMLDEVQCGIGRTGTWFAFQHAGIVPDVMTLAKGLGSGMPIGACLAAGKATGTFGPGNHGSTFGGNPLACTAASTTLKVIEEDKLMENAHTIGDFLLNGLKERLGHLDGVVEIRGQGLMLGIALAKPCGVLVGRALEQGLLINVTVDTVVRLLPALIFSQADAQLLLDKLCPLITEFLSQDA